MRFGPATRIGVASVIAALAISTGIYFARNSGTPSTAGVSPAHANASKDRTLSTQASGQAPGEPAAKKMTLEAAQLTAIKVEPAGEHLFTIQKEAVGNIEFNQDRTVQVYPPNQGKIIELFANLGDNVLRGEKLYTINSPDLIQAESTLISTAGAFELTTHALERARKLFETQGIAEKDLQQATSDQQAAEGALRAARHAVSIFGKTEAEIDQIVARRRIDPVMVVDSPITGRITARNAAPGLLVQPGSAPAPYSVADISTMWMQAYVTESDSPLFRPGQEVRVRLMAFPGRVFEGKVSTMGEIVDPATHRLLVRSFIRDPRHELRPGMLATFCINTGTPVRSLAVPLEGVVREGDGTMSVWSTADRRTFVRHTVKVGLQQDGYHQIIEGLQAGELVVTQGALFLSNALENESH